LVLGGPLARPARAIDLVFDYISGEEPAWDSDGAILRSIFEAAAGYWESIFVSSRTIEVDIEWDDDLDAGILGLWTPDPVGSNNIEISSTENFWADPTPFASEEFDLTQTRYEELTATQQNNWYNGPAPNVLEVGWEGNALPGSGVGGNHDLLSICIHELGHELGVRSGVGPVFPVYAQHVGGAVGVEAVKHAEGGHLADPHAVMFATFNNLGGERRLPSAIDLLAVAHTAGYTTLMLPRTEFIGVNGDFSSSLNWIGGMSTSFLDATVRNAGSALNATAAADMSFVNLTLVEGGWASTGSHTLDVAQTLTIDGAWAAAPARLSVNIGGTLEADDVRLVNSGQLMMWGGLAVIDRFDVVGPFTGQFAMSPGATLRVDRLTGFGNNLQFLGNLQIGNSAGGILNVGAGQSLWVVGAMTVGPSPGASGTVTVSAGAQADTGPLQVGSNGASGVVTLTGFSGAVMSDWDVTGDLTIGSGGVGAGTMTIQNLAACDVTGAATVRGSAAAPGRLVVRGGGSFEAGQTLSILPFGRVETSEPGTTLIADGIALSAGGAFSAAAGTTVRVNRLTGFGDHLVFWGSLELGHPGGLAGHSVGAGQSLVVAEKFTIGGDAPATFNIHSGGTVESERSFIGKEPLSSGSSMTVASGSSWHVLDQLYVGGDETYAGGAATLTLSGGGQVDVDGLLYVLSNSFVTVGAASTVGTLTVRDVLRMAPGATVTVGNAGNLYANSIDFTGGGILSTIGPNATVYTNGILGLGGALTINGNLGVGWSGGSGVGSVTIAGESLNVTGVLSLGDDSTGTLTVSHGGNAQFDQARVGDDGSGTLVVSGDTTVVQQNGDFSFGYYGAGATGALRIEGGALVLANGHVGSLGPGVGTTGTALVSEPNSRWRGLESLYVGGNALGAQGSGALTVSNGGSVEINSGLQVWNTGRVELLGGSIYAGSFFVEPGGEFIHHDGTLSVDGGAFNPGATYNYSVDGPTPNQRPTVVLRNGARCDVPNTLFVGGDHAGELRLESGAVLNSFNGRVGWTAGTGDGRVIVDGAGSRWTNAADLEIGVRNYGEMYVSSGGAVENTIGAIGAVPGSAGRVIVSNGGRWQNSDGLYVGGKFGPGGSGALIIQSAEATATFVTVWPQGTISLAGGSLDAANIGLFGGTLEGAGALGLAGPLANEGRVAPGAPVGLLAARGGDYLQSSEGALAIDIASSRIFDKLSIGGGSAMLAGALNVSLFGGYVPDDDAQFEILWADNGVYGAFDPLKTTFPTLGGALDWSIGYRENSVVLQVLHAAFAGGDFNGDSVVDGADLAMWRTGFGMTYATHDDGDADGDHDIDGADFLTWQRQLGSGATSVWQAAGLPADAGSVGYGGSPEPASVALAIVGFVLGLPLGSGKRLKEAETRGAEASFVVNASLRSRRSPWPRT
jgi:T5SS/PEP-CTERM-associated repeat protein